MIEQSCKESTQASSSVEVEESIPESFFNFYTRFHSDSSFQMQHIAFPIPEIEEGQKYTVENWILNKPFSVDDETYKREIQSVNGIIHELIYHTQGIFILERRFAQLSGNEWNLIFYKVTTELDDGWEK